MSHLALHLLVLLVVGVLLIAVRDEEEFRPLMTGWAMQIGLACLAGLTVLMIALDLWTWWGS